MVLVREPVPTLEAGRVSIILPQPSKEAAENVQAELHDDGFDVQIEHTDDGWRVIVHGEREPVA